MLVRHGCGLVSLMLVLVLSEKKSEKFGKAMNVCSQELHHLIKLFCCCYVVRNCLVLIIFLRNNVWHSTLHIEKKYYRDMIIINFQFASSDIDGKELRSFEFPKVKNLFSLHVHALPCC